MRLEPRLPSWYRALPSELGFLGAASRGLPLGVIAAGALPPLTLVPLLALAIPGLLLVLGRARNWRVAGAAGLGFGMGYHLAGLYWITEAILVMADQFWWAVPIAVPLLSAVLGLFIAVPCALAFAVPAGPRRLAVLAGVWVTGDLARQFALTGFPWNLLGSTWEMPGRVGLVFMQPAAWVGAHGLTLMTILLAGSIGLGRRGRVAGFVLFCIWGSAGTWRLSSAEPPSAGGQDLVAVIAQGNVSEADHRDHGGDRAWADQIFDRYLALTRRGVAEAGGHPAIVVWPETASPYALAQDRGARLALADAAVPASMVLAGTERFEASGAAHNSLVAVAPGGDVAGVYDKSHLVPFGEYFPPYAHFLLGEQGFTPGPGLRTMHLAGLPAVGPLICYEAIFPAQVVQTGDRPAMLVNITNDAWFGDSAGPRQHLAAARLRAVEEGLPMVRAANTGISAVIDAYGRVTGSLALDRVGVLIRPIPARVQPTLASRFGLAIPFGLALMTAFGGFIGRSKQDRFV